MANNPIAQNSQRYQFKHQLDIGDEFLPPLKTGTAAPDYGIGAHRANPTTGIMEYWNGAAWTPYGNFTFYSTAGSLVLAQRINNTLIGVIDRYTGDYLAFNKVTTFGDGTTMTDAKVDGILYIKVGTEYFLRQTNGELDIRWFGAVGDNNTDNTTALNACATAIRLSTGYRYTMKLPAGRYKTGKIDCTGVFTIQGVNGKTTLLGLPGQDILYWKNVSEVGYIALNTTFWNDLTLNVDDSTDVSGSYKRIGFGGEIIGNAGIVLPVTIRPTFRNILINVVNGPVSGPGNRAAGLFCSGAAYAMTFDGVCNFAGMDYPIVAGTSETYTPIAPVKVTANDGTTFTAVNTWSNGMKAAVIYDINDGSLSTIIPRTLLYVVNVTGTTLQLSATPGGTAISFTVTGTPAIFIVPAGSDAIEYANDEWAWAQFRVTGKRVSFSVANLCESATGHLVMQSNGVSCRILNFPSANRQYSVHVHMQLLDTEGPAYIATLTNKEYARIEGEYIVVENGPYMAASTTGSYITIATNNSTFNGFLLSNVSASTPVNYMALTGNRNDIKTKNDVHEGNIIDTGEDNVCVTTAAPSGDTPRIRRTIGPKTIRRIQGGFWPDALNKGVMNLPYQSEGVLFYPATAQLFAGTPDITYRFDDATIETSGYVRKATAGQLTIVSPLGSNSNSFTIGKFFPAGKWILFAKVRSLTTTQTMAIAFQQLAGTGSFTVSGNRTITTAWSLIKQEVDTTTALSDLRGQFYVTGVTEGFDIAYFHIVPYSARAYMSLIDFGPNASGGTVSMISTTGTGSPEGVVTGAVGSEYVDRTGVPGLIKWGKQTGTGNTGWVPVW